MSQLDVIFCMSSFIEMSFGKCRQKIPPDSLSFHERTLSKSHTTPLLIKTFLVSSLTSLFLEAFFYGCQKVAKFNKNYFHSIKIYLHSIKIIFIR